MARGTIVLRGAALGLAMVVWAGQTGEARAQLDPDDPWPKFGRDIRNSCYSPNRGPHSVPQLRWWGHAGTGHPSDTVRGGAAIGEIQGTRCVFVLGDVWDTDCDPDNTRPVLFVYRFHPCDSDYDTEDPATPLMRIVLGACSGDLEEERAYSTPLVLANDHVVVQTTHRVLCFAFRTE